MVLAIRLSSAPHAATLPFLFLSNKLEREEVAMANGASGTVVPHPARTHELLTSGAMPATVPGGVLIRHLQWLEAQRDADAVMRVRRTVEAAGHRLPATSQGTCEFAALIAADLAIAKEFGHDPLAVAQELGRFSAISLRERGSKWLNGKALHDYFAGSAATFATHQTFGVADYERTGEQAGRFTLQLRCYSPVYCASMLGYFLERLRFREEAASVEETECVCGSDERCVFEISW
jgi:hypothetical protein